MRILTIFTKKLFLKLKSIKMSKVSNEEEWIILTDFIDLEDAFSVELKEELTEANIPFVVEIKEESESSGYWIMVENDNFDDAYSLLKELETAYGIAANDAKWIKLTSFIYEVDPELAFLQNELRNNDIKFTVWNSNLSSINPLMAGATGGVQVMITEPDSEKALEILRDVHRQMEAVREDTRPKNTGCMGGFLVIVLTLVYCLV
jgi:hypothetical protein